MAFKANPDWFSNNFVRWYNFLIPNITKKSLHIFTVSNFSKNEIIKYTGVEEHKVTVVYNGIPDFGTVKNQKDSIIKGDYVLTVGTLSKRKNQAALISAFLKMQDYPLKLVIAGNKDKKVFGDNETNEEIKNASTIHFVESPDDSTLYNLYKYASFTIYIPHYEGFGLPVVESLSFNKPVIVSDIFVFRELFSEYVYFLNPNNSDDICISIKEMHQMKNEWISKISTSQSSKNMFSYQKSTTTIEKVMATYQKK